MSSTDTSTGSRKALDRARRMQPRNAEGFDVTVQMKIGEVSFDAMGSMSPIEGAFNLIAGYIQHEHVTEGMFEFPSADGGRHVVSFQTLDTTA